MASGSLTAEKLLVCKGGLSYYSIIFIINIVQVFIGRNKSWENETGYSVLVCLPDIRYKLDLKTFLPGILNIKIRNCAYSIVKNLFRFEKQTVSMARNNAQFVLSINSFDIKGWIRFCKAF